MVAQKSDNAVDTSSPQGHQPSAGSDNSTGHPQTQVRAYSPHPPPHHAGELSHASQEAHHAPAAHEHKQLGYVRPEFVTRRSTGRVRTLSTTESNHRKNEDAHRWGPPVRRLSNDLDRRRAVEFEIYVDETYAALIRREDTDNNVQITVEDKGPKWINLGTLASEGHFKRDIRTTYHLSNLLQELYLAKTEGLKRIVLSEDQINENPVVRLSRMIKDSFWQNLTRRIDGSNVAVVGKDPKDWTSHPRPRIYIPVGAPEQYAYYRRIAREHPEVNLDVQWLSSDPSNEEYVRDLNAAPGLLALEMERIQDTPSGEPNYRGLPFVVPGGRFNELYGWDSYMESLGLIINGKVDLAMNMVKHFCFCIKHYGKILNANRSYYLCRTQPPFLTDMSIRVYEKIKHQPGAKDFLRSAILAAIKEYYSVWMSRPRYDPESGLSRYRAQGIGVPPETEATHFTHILTDYARKYNMTYAGFIDAYNHGKVDEPALDKFFLHDRAVRESGHDTSYRLEGRAADLAVVDLNSCLYKYETDIAHIINTEFDGRLVIPAEFATRTAPAGHLETPDVWSERALRRREQMIRLMWDADIGMFIDYHCVHKARTGYESATTFWALWSGVATEEQAAMMVAKGLPLLEVGGGVVSGTAKSRGLINMTRPNRQWDYPFGWAPQQILTWHGLERYGYVKEAKRLAYRWLFMITKAFVDFNGIVVEKYNVTDPKRPHLVSAEYGNQGADFKGIPREGFGWVNASYIVGLELLDPGMRRRLGALASWEEYTNKAQPRHRASSVYAEHSTPEGKESAHGGQPAHTDQTTHSGQEHQTDQTALHAIQAPHGTQPTHDAQSTHDTQSPHGTQAARGVHAGHDEQAIYAHQRAPGDSDRTASSGSASSPSTGASSGSRPQALRIMQVDGAFDLDVPDWAGDIIEDDDQKGMAEERA